MEMTPGVAWFYLCTVLVAVVLAFAMKPEETISQSSVALTGYAWSDTIGWISLHCSNHGTCGTSNYGLSIATDGTISGYAWSDNVGWVSADSSDLTGCPTSPCTARMSEYAMQGWLKARAASDAQSGGWDGFISLSGSGYGPTLSGNTFSGYAWGDTNVGWLSFSSAYHSARTDWNPVCENSYICTDITHRQSACSGAPIEACSSGLICSGGGCVIPPAPSTGTGRELLVQPDLITQGQSVNVSWGPVANADTCSVTEDNPSPAVNDLWTGVSGSYQSDVLDVETTYTLLCAGAGGNLTQTATVNIAPSWREK